MADLSVISLAKALPALMRRTAERFDCLALVKPQFEVGRELVGKGGVVREPADRRSRSASTTGRRSDRGR